MEHAAQEGEGQEEAAQESADTGKEAVGHAAFLTEACEATNV